MDVFNLKIYDDYVSGTQAVYTPTMLSETLGSADRIACAVYTRSGSGTSPTITVQVEQSFDGSRWQNQSATPELNNSPVGVGIDTYRFIVSDPTGAGVPGLQFIRLRITLGGTSPACILQMWAVGRTPTS